MTAGRNQRQRLREAALAYANTGWPVLPLRPGSKRPATPNHTADACDGSDPRCAATGHIGWEARATTDPGRIARAWDRRPYGIGVACGPAGLVVVDLDVAKHTAASGADTLAALEHDRGETLPATWTVGTPSGGRHLYYRRTAGLELGNTAGRVGPGIDTRAGGGYVVAPPTITRGAGGGEYWLVDDHPPAELPGWFGRLLSPQRLTRSQSSPRSGPDRRDPVAATDRARHYAACAVSGELTQLANAREGQRNHRLFLASIALGQLAGAGLITVDEVEGKLLDAAERHVAAGAYSTHQARQTIASGLRRGLAEPRRLPTELATAGAAL